MGEKKAWIGLDESGKGDYFGPLVVAGVCMTPALAASLRELGVRDSKKVSDSRVMKLDSEIRSKTHYSVVSIGPERYNELYDKMKNLNRLLAWGHARALENLRGKVDCDRALADQFGDVKLIQNALLEKGKKIFLEQRVRAEEDTAVAAASIVARAEFLRRLDGLREKHGLKLPKGASTEVQNAVRELIKKYPVMGNRKALLKKVAKWHFRTTRQAGIP